MTIDREYMHLLLPSLIGAKETPSSIRFQCPYCQVGTKIPAGKCKGYLYEKNNWWNFKCHKCSTGKSLGNFLMDHFPEHYLDYVIKRDRAGLTGWGSNCPTLETALKRKDLLPSPPKFGNNSVEDSSVSSDCSGKGQEAPGCNKAPRITKLPPMRSPQQQAGQQARLNHLMNQRQKRLDN